jgi:rod shape-determining protein MreC
LRVARTGEAAIGEGRGDGTLDVRATALGAQHFRRGDLLVTSGVGGVYPPGLPVAVVMTASGEVGSGRPLADPATLDFAAVLPEVAIAPPPPAPIGAAH